MGNKRFQYKVLNACKHPCVCADRYAGIVAHTMFQWGRDADAVEEIENDERPRLPVPAEQLVRGVAEHLVQVATEKEGPPAGREGRRRWQGILGNFYVVANRYHNDTAIGTHTDYNPLYSENGQPQVVLSCNISGDGILWIGPTQNGFTQPGMMNRSIKWIHERFQSKSADKGILAFYLQKDCVVPIWAPANSIIVMGGTFQENMIHWTDRRKDLLKSLDRPFNLSLEPHLKHFAAKNSTAFEEYFRRNPREKEMPVRHVLTFRYILNHEPMCMLADAEPAWPPPPPPGPPPGAISAAVPVAGDSAVAGGSAGSGAAVAGFWPSRTIAEAFPDVEPARVPAEAGALPTAAADIVSEPGSSRVAAPAATGVVPGGEFSCWWASSLLSAVFDLAGHSLPNLDVMLDLSASAIINPRFAEHPLEWTRVVNASAIRLREVCEHIEQHMPPHAVVDAKEFKAMMILADRHIQRLVAMRMHFEILAGISKRFTKHPGVFGHGGELYHPHDTLNKGYTGGKRAASS